MATHGGGAFGEGRSAEAWRRDAFIPTPFVYTYYSSSSMYRIEKQEIESI